MSEESQCTITFGAGKPSLCYSPERLSFYRQRAQEYIRHSKSSNTIRAYAADWRDFFNFCQTEGLHSLPASADTIGFYLSWLVDVHKRKTGVLTRRLSAISQVHQAAGFDSPTKDPVVRAVMAGIRRTHGTLCRAKEPLLPETLKALLRQIPPGTLRGLRDRALLLIGFAGGFRRGELAGIRMADLELKADGILIRIPRSKGDQEGAGQMVGIPCGQNEETCPVRALQIWIEAASIREGWVFRATAPWTGEVLERRLESKRVATLLQQLAAKAGLDTKKFAAHSLRSGLATAAAAGGASERSIMEHLRHKSVKQVRRYIQRGTVLLDNPATFTGI